jgi:Rrf2 family protein
MRALVRARLVRSRRGVGGGYELAETPARLTVLSVVQAVDPIRRIATCPLELSQHRGGLCPLHRRLDQAAASLEALLGGTSILELLDVPRARRPLCLARPGRRGG